MAGQTNIEWTDFNWNFLRGCSRVSEGCRNCYAESIAARFSQPGQPYEGLAKHVNHEARWTGEISFHENILLEPLKWRKPRRVFVNSMSDLFHEKVKDEWLDKAFAVMALTPQHTYQVLTKRPERMKHYLSMLNLHNVLELAADRLLPGKGHPSIGGQHLLPALPLPNVHLGVSVEDQKTADERIPLLLQTPAAVRWVSYEPALGQVKWTEWEFLNQLICGGESGPRARAMHPDWARGARDFCVRNNIPFFFKQWGAWMPVAEMYSDDGPDKAFEYSDYWVAQMEPNGAIPVMSNPIREREDQGWCEYQPCPGSWFMAKVGKKMAGHVLDGVEWSGLPK